jgi:hypothetical protein
MELYSGFLVILWTLILTPVVYCVYHVVDFILDVRKRGQAVDKFPGEPKHWLWGNLHLVTIFILTVTIYGCCTLCLARVLLLYCISY